MLPIAHRQPIVSNPRERTIVLITIRPGGDKVFGRTEGHLVSGRRRSPAPTGVFGMNFVDIPFIDEPVAPFLILGVMGLIAAGVITWSRRKHWL